MSTNKNQESFQSVKTKSLLSANDYKNFTDKEIACKCCGQVYVNKYAMDKLQLLRDTLNRPIIITSACRCRVHNKNIGGASSSRHIFDKEQALSSTAFDVAYKDYSELYKLLQAVFEVGFNGIGINFKKMFIHVDTRDTQLVFPY